MNSSPDLKDLSLTLNSAFCVFIAVISDSLLSVFALSRSAFCCKSEVVLLISAIELSID